MKLWRYIEGLHKGKEAHRLEKEAMNDPFLADALEGYSKVEGNHAEEIKKLQILITVKAAKKKPNYVKAWSIAAGILLVVGFGTWYTLHEFLPDEEVLRVAQKPVEQLEEKNEDLVARNNIPESDSVLPEQEEETAQPQKEAKPVSPSPPVEVATAPAAPLAQVMDATSVQAEEKMEVAKEQVSAALRGRVADVAVVPDLALSLVPVVKGRVVDEWGDPIAGASVVLNDSSGTITNLDGYFELTTNDGEKMQVNFLGFEPQILQADTSQTMLIAMHEDNAALNEVVVIGYGVSKKQVRTGNAIKVKTPEPVDGKKAYNDYLKKNLVRIVDDCSEAKGKVVLTFFVNESGRPYDVKVKKSLCPSADGEAIRLVLSGPKWTTEIGEATITVTF